MTDERSDEALSADDAALGAELRPEADEGLDETDADAEEGIELDLEGKGEDPREPSANGEGSDEEALLELSALAPVRQKIRIHSYKREANGEIARDPDGEPITEARLYEMAMPSELGAARQQQVFSRGRLIDRLLAKGRLSAKERDHLKLAIDQAARLVLPAEIDGLPNVSDEVFAELPDDHKRAAVDAFFAVYAEKRAEYLTRLLRRTEGIDRLISAS